ncbi:hypothetical protein RJ639_014598 [Escallonia herrerae]|uniref:dolichyl-P-Man:Man5GlcNAc2-PP-dolichol alpha-1,3-mannosyltransferase n=1 Tax=Escallonia herrerae TaxID=1293975 RepID=A0AA88VIC4_9ASTE|nr:hypothetical protein RJ639_014598 [Escallonia herrerae]
MKILSLQLRCTRNAAFWYVAVLEGAGLLTETKTLSMERKRRSSRESMAVAKRKPSTNPLLKLYTNPKAAFPFALLLADALLVALIIIYIRRSIGMRTCRRQVPILTHLYGLNGVLYVSGFLGGERDYTNLKGDTGPLVYPAGFLYIYSAVQYVTGGQVYPAQILFGVLYIVNLGVVLFVYVKTDVLPWWALFLLCLSKRVHSIFVLRLFNDCFAMTLLHASLISFLYHKWHLGLIIFSGAVSVKMNVLLYAPPLLLLMFKAMNIAGVISALAGAALVQILLGLPFIVAHPISYVSGAFNLGRVFIHFWYFLIPDKSVNFKFVPEPVFVSKQFAVSLLTAHLILLTVFAHYRWCKHEGGIVSFLHSKFLQMKLKAAVSSSFSLGQFYNRDSSSKLLQKEHIVTTMFVGNFVGILTVSVVENTVPYIATVNFISRGGVLLECLSLDYVLIFPAPLYPLTDFVGSMDCSTRISIRGR